MGRKMRICFVGYNANANGSVMNTTRRQAEHLANSGHEVLLISNREATWDTVTYLDPGNDSETRKLSYIVNGIFRRLPKSLSAIDIREYYVQSRFVNRIENLFLSSELLQKCDGIVCCQHFVTFALSKIRKQFGIPYVLVAHGDIFTHPRKAFPIAVRRFYQRAARHAYQNADLLVAVSSSLAKRAVELGRCESTVEVIANGIDVGELGEQPNVVRQDRGATHLLYVGRLSPEKNVSCLLKALVRLKDLNIVTTIVGEGPERKRLEAAAQHAKINSVTFVGYVHRKGLASYYASCDIVVLPSLTEAQPVTTLEAGIASRPIIAADVGGVADVVKNRVTGVLYSSDSVSELENAIRELATDSALRYKMGVNARAAVEDYRWPNVLSRFCSAIEKTF